MTSSLDTPPSTAPQHLSDHWDAQRPAVTAALQDVFTHQPLGQRATPGFRQLWTRLQEQVAGGKLIRPRLTLLAWTAFADGNRTDQPGARDDDADADAVRLAAAFELLHSALLIHDDVVDRDHIRRGQPTVAERYRQDIEAVGAPEEEALHLGRSAAIIAGDVLLTTAYRLVSTCAPGTKRGQAVAAVVFDAATQAAAGELEDVLLSLHRFTPPHPDVEQILTMERLKTASYSFEAPLRAGALLAGAPAETADRLAEAGSHLGVAYQVIDDLLGTFGDPERTGKSTTADLREGKATVLTAHGSTQPAVIQSLRDWAEGRGTVEQVRTALEQAGAPEHAAQVAAELVDRARTVLDGLDLPEPARQQLHELCADVLHREA